MSKYLDIIKFHGPVRGLMRAYDELVENDIYDWRHGISTAPICTGPEFTNQAPGATVHYQPVYASALKRPLKWLKRYACPSVHGDRVCFIDLGCGRGKALHVARSVLPEAELIGIDLHAGLLKQARKNLGIGPELIHADVLAVDYRKLLDPFRAVVAFNKNSFSMEVTAAVVDKLRDAIRGRGFMIYNNPLYGSLFDDPHIWQATGWHKNLRTKVWTL